MAKSTKLRTALDRYQGNDHRLEKQRKHEKLVQKKKSRKEQAKAVEQGPNQNEHAIDGEEKEGGIGLNGVVQEGRAEEFGATEADGPEWADEEVQNGWETDEASENGSEEVAEEERRTALVDTSRLDESDTSSSEDEDGVRDEAESGENREEGEGDIPLSDVESLASEEKGDLLPHQRLTINNTSALTRSLNSIALPYAKLSFSEHQTITSNEPTSIPDINDDLNRELALYKQSLSAVLIARSKLQKQGIPFSRPADYFAEMVKSDEHMGRVKKKLVDEASSRKASSEAKRARDAKKFAKQVQVAKMQERDKAKRDTLDKIGSLKRKRQGADLENAHEEDLFDVAIEDAAESERKDKAARKAGGGAGRPNTKRQKRDEKYGFGGKKRFGKSNDAESTSDMSGYSVKKMKGQKKGPQRPGKSKRARAR